MWIEFERDEIQTNRLFALQKHLNKPLTEIVAILLSPAIDKFFTETEGLKRLKIRDKPDLLSGLEDHGRLSVEYQKHLWNQE